MARHRRNRLGFALLTAVFVLGSAMGARAAGAQDRTATASADAAADTLDPLSRALDAEDRGQLVVAASAYREVLQRALIPGGSDGDRVALALLGLERVWAEMGARDSILPVVRRVLTIRPTDPTAHSIQLRSLVALARDDEARESFAMWRRAAGNDGAPYREYARLLLAQGRAQAADSVLADAGRLLGAAGMLSGEVAQLHVALNRWQAAAVAFRESFADQPYLETAALYGLQRAPAEARDSIRTVLLATPVQLLPRRLLSALELSWGEPRRAWAAIASVQPDDSTAASWRAFGERAEVAQSWLVARDAWSAVFERRGDLEAQQRAAQAALNADDADGALVIVRRPTTTVAKSGTNGTTGVATTNRDVIRLQTLLPIEIAALGELGRPAEAQQRLDAASRQLDPQAREAMARPLVTAYLRAGDLTRAKAAVQGTDLEEDDETAGWFALYEGDLVTARKRLVRAATQRATLVDALGLLARTRTAQSPALGRAFLLLAQRDSARAAKAFVALADTLADAAPALLGLGARLSDAPTALTLWDRVIATWPTSPEAAESLLASARARRAAKDIPSATARLERLLIEYPTSALLPQARRELEQLRGQVPPSESASQFPRAFR